jgi:hypothetical protein
VTRNALSALQHGFRFIPQALEQPDFFASIIEKLEQEANIQPGTIAVLYDDHAMLFELFEFAKQLRKKGRSVIVSHLNRCEYRNHQLILEGQDISTVVNNFFLRGKNLQLDQTGPWETYTPDNPTHPYWALCQAVKDRSIVLTHGFGACLLIEDKRFFAIFGSPTFSYLFSAEDQRIIEQWIPYTLSNDMLLQDAQLQEEVLLHQDQYIYKAALSGAGLGVIFGDSISSEEWRTLLQHSPVPYAIQKKVIPHPFTILSPSPMVLHHNLSYYVVWGELAGCHSRVSNHPIVTAQAKNRTAFCQPVLVEAPYV